MLSSSRPRIFSYLWLFLPTLLWSLSLQSFIFCIDPFFLPEMERHVPKLLARLLRWSWIVIFATTILSCWNILPATYWFYLQEALPYSPVSVSITLFIAAVLLIWFGLQNNTSAKPATTQFFWAGVAFLLFKGTIVVEALHRPALRQLIGSPTIFLGSPTIFTIRAQFPNQQTKIEAVESTVTGVAVSSDTFYSFLQLQNSLPKQVVLMVVESWAEQKDGLSRISDDIASQGFQIVKHGFTPYQGATLSGEFRELCSKYVQPTDGLMNETKNMTCAPLYMQHKGYQVFGYHGYKKTFYARATFWQRFGIRKQVFGDEMKAQPQCPGPFSAVCDENLIQDGIAALDATDKPTFLYMLTVSSHEPLDPASLERRGAYFNDVPVVHQTQIITRRAISSLIDDLKKRRSQACTLVYIVGDHQPPSASVRGGIFEAAEVPYLALRQHCSPASEN